MKMNEKRKKIEEKKIIHNVFIIELFSFVFLFLFLLKMYSYINCTKAKLLQSISMAI